MQTSFPYTPRWLRDLIRFLPLKSQFILCGNVRDRYPLEIAPGKFQPVALLPFLANHLSSHGIRHLLRYEPANGFQILARRGLTLANEIEFFRAHPRLQRNWDDQGRASASVGQFFETLPLFVDSELERIAIFADFSSRYLVRSDTMSLSENANFTRALVLAHESKPRSIDGSAPLFNPVFWIADKEGDLPPWFVIGNPRLRTVMVPEPDRVARAYLAASLLEGLDGYDELSQTERTDLTERFVDQTGGLLLLDLVSITELCRLENVHCTEIEEGVRRFKLGVTENPWAQLSREKIAEGEAFVRRRVKGQGHAVTKALDIVKRAVIGLSGSTDRGGGRPRGIAFFAGPTGTGKTELAKTITELLFGDESAYTRFDMSEFSAEHSDQRLIGAPPGYLGYDEGGELTNAIREKPFSVVLFDEIEKAHPRILDKFLQILDDGVLTSGRGERVYFSDAFIIFTSNLGINRIKPDGTREPNVHPDDPYETVARKVRAEIDRYFKLELGRPEILNRVGENIIVFDFIRTEIAEQIYEMMLSGILERVQRTSGAKLTLSPEANATLKKLCLSDLGNGGRGIRNQLEAHFVNPLARALFEHPGGAAEVKAVRQSNGITSLELG